MTAFFGLLSPADHTLSWVSAGQAPLFQYHAFKKFTLGKFKQIIEDVKSQSMDKQLLYFESELSSWQGKHEQTDDITVLGIKL